MKFYILTESDTSYVLQFRMYDGIHKSVKDTVNDLIKNYNNLYHRLFMDNYYNSFELNKQLLDKRI